MLWARVWTTNYSRGEDYFIVYSWRDWCGRFCSLPGDYGRAWNSGYGWMLPVSSGWCYGMLHSLYLTADADCRLAGQLYGSWCTVFCLQRQADCGWTLPVSIFLRYGTLHNFLLRNDAGHLLVFDLCDRRYSFSEVTPSGIHAWRFWSLLLRQYPCDQYGNRRRSRQKVLCEIEPWRSLSEAMLRRHFWCRWHPVCDYAADYRYLLYAGNI